MEKYRYIKCLPCAQKNYMYDDRNTYPICSVDREGKVYVKHRVSNTFMLISGLNFTLHCHNCGTPVLSQPEPFKWNDIWDLLPLKTVLMVNGTIAGTL